MKPAVPICLSFAAVLSSLAGENAIYLAQSGLEKGLLVHEGGAWKLGERRLSSQELLLAQFSAPSGSHPTGGVFLRDGALLCGTLESLIGEEAQVHALSLNRSLKLKSEDVAGAFHPLALGQDENLPDLGEPQLLLMALRALQRDPPFAEGLPENLKPGQRNHVLYKNRDQLDGRLVRLSEEKALIDLPDGRLAAPRRDLIRLVEFRTPPLPAPSDKDRAQGTALTVRLKPGDVLRGRITKLDERELTLTTACAGELRIPRESLEMLYPAGERGSGWTWLSSVRPTRANHTPVFDASFPPRPNASCCGQTMQIAGLPCELGVGVHSRTELAYDLRNQTGRRFVALVGLDDESKGRGDAVAHVLLDGREVWTSGSLRPGAAPRHVTVELGEAKELVLLVDYGPDGDDSGDHVDWAWAALIGP